MKEYHKKPTPMELATLAANMGDTSLAGIQRAYVAYYNAGGVLMTADMVMDMSPAMYPEFVACLDRGDNVDVAIGNAAYETFPTRDKAMELLAVRDMRTIHSILEWGTKYKKITNADSTEILRAFQDTSRTHKITHGMIRRLSILKHDKKSMEGKRNRLSASKPRRKRKAVN